MTISYYSYIHSIIITTIIISLICFIRNRYRFTHPFEVRIFASLYFICFIRMFFPFDFKITKGIPFQGIYSILFRKLIYKNIIIFEYSISPVEVITIVLFCISLFRILQYIKKYRKILRDIRKYSYYRPSQIQTVKKLLAETYPELPDCDILEISYINIPMVVGVIHKTILLPPANYSDIELYYILLHEYTHIINHDLLRKILIDIFSCILWWIPCIRFAKQDIDQLIEINCDERITKNLSVHEKIEYMYTLLEAVKRSSNNKEYIGHLGFALMENYHPMIERFKLMTLTSQKKNKVLLNSLILILGLLFIIGSYLVAPIPKYEANINDIENCGYTYVTSENTYLYEENGKYYIITNGNIKSKISKEHVKFLIENGIKFK